jgi:hypothetical protein
LSRSRLSSDWALTPSSLAQIRNHLPHHHNITIHTQIFARRDTEAPGVRHFHSPTGTGSEDPAEKPLPPLDGQIPWPTEMGLTLVTPRRHKQDSSFGTFVKPRWTPPSSSPTGRRNPGTSRPCGPPRLRYRWRGLCGVARDTHRKYHTTRTLRGRDAFSSSSDGPRGRLQAGGVLCGANALWKIPRGSQRSVYFGTITRSNDLIRLRLQVGTISRLLWH